jgi:AraC-like DNA-binding protein
MDYILIITNIILFFFIAYSGYYQNAIKQVLPSPVLVKHKNKTTTAGQNSQIPPKKNSNPIIEKLLQFMEKEKPYLDQELNIGFIANQLNIHVHKLSRLINDEIGKNFFEFVNEYRVEEFKRLATNPKNKHISILGLAMEAGFNSKATFYRFFKSKTGLTPSEFMESYKFK